VSQLRIRCLLLAIVGLWLSNRAPVQAFDPHCGDAICQEDACGEWQTFGDGCRETPDSCPDDCGYCGDGTCDFDYESQSSCSEDCGYCGDGLCQVYIESNVNLSATRCTADCGSGWSNGECATNSECGSGEYCNSMHQCVPGTSTQAGEHSGQCGGSCTSKNDCCGNEICYGNDYGGSGYCAGPDTSACQDAPSCSSNNDCYSYFGCDALFPCYDMYCSPATGRCDFMESYAWCPDVSNVYY
jgi:hypothetical protein